MDLSAESFESLSKRLKKHTKQWLKADQHAQLHRNADPSLMDIYDTATSKGMHMIIIKEIQCLRM
jgi:flagellar motility protein MotE (MotC chaperone)